MRLLRDSFSDNCTLGTLSIGNQIFQTLEDVVRDGPKIPGKTAIPAGSYKVIINWSSRFQKHMPLLLDVPGFDGIRIHSGNTAADTEGCILLGLARGEDSVLNSRKALDIFMPLLQDAISCGNNFIEVS